MTRRHFLLGSAAAAGALSMPRIGRADAKKVLRFIPNSDLTIVDPYISGAYVTKIHGFMAYDTLYGLDDNFRPQLQMLQSQAVEQDGRLWRLTLREKLRFHDGEPVLARDVVASLKRWGRSDAFGQSLMAVTDELSASSDREIRFRLKSPFPLLPDALAKTTVYLPVIMPERLANSPLGKPITEVVGSGPFRYVASERVDGAQTVYERFADYVPRADGATQFTAGPKVVHVDRVEWRVILDDATAAAALRQGEVDWWERPQLDYLSTLARDRNLVVEVIDKTGFMGIVRYNHLHPPFDNPAIRRATLGMIDVPEMMSVVAGTDRSMWEDAVGVFCPESPMANDVGLSALTSKRDRDATKRALKEAGYRGEKVVCVTPTNNQATNALGQVVADALSQGGMNVELVAMDFGAWLTRRTNRNPPDKGGWNCSTSFLSGLDMWDPAGHLAIRGNGERAWQGWPTSARLEDLRDKWLSAPDESARKALAADIQRQVWEDVPYVPAGRWRQPTAYRRGMTGILRGMPLFHNVKM